MKVNNLLRSSLPAIVSMALLSTPLAAGPALWPQSTSSPGPAVKADDVRIAGQDVPVPTRKKYVAPEYPAEAATQGIRGIVIVEVLIGEDGGVASARVIRSIPGLDEAAVAAVKLWEYEVTKVAGKAVRVQLSQSITFALRLPDLQRAIGVPELKSGGAPPVPASLKEAATAMVAITLGAQGEVTEAIPGEGNPLVSAALLRAVKAWRFVVTEGSAPPSFTVRAEWSPGPPPVLTLKAMDPTTPAGGAPAATASAAVGPSLPASAASPTEAIPAAPKAAVATPDMDVIPARQEPPAKEQGASAVGDVVLGDNIPDLTRGRRPVWPPLARLGNVTGDVVVRFSVDLAGKVTVHSAEGPELLKSSAEQAVGTWLFRRTAIDRLRLIATFTFAADRSVARVQRAPDEAS